jgi:hypothetical protein|nr:MAG TPA: Middle operon regulator, TRANSCRIPTION.2A [Caudoviricetes sp.]
MQVIDILKVSRSSIELQKKYGIKVEDVKYIPLYDEYQAMVAEGKKTVYVVAILAEKYGLSERSVYSVIKRLKKVVK